MNAKATSGIVFLFFDIKFEKLTDFKYLIPEKNPVLSDLDTSLNLKYAICSPVSSKCFMFSIGVIFLPSIINCVTELIL